MILDILKKINYLLKITTGRKIILVSIFFSITIVLSELLGLASFLPVISSLTDNKKYTYDINYFIEIIPFFKNSSLSQIEISLIFLVLVFLIKSIIVYCANKIVNKITVIFLNQLSTKILNLYLSQDYEFFLQNNSSKLVNICNNHAQKIKIILDNIINLCIEIFISFIIIITLLIFFGKLTILLFLFFTFFVFVYIIILKKTFLILGKNNQDYQFKMSKILTEIFNSIKELNLFNKKEVFVSVFNKHRGRLSQNDYIQSILNFVPKFWIEFITVFGFSFIVYYYTSSSSSLDLINILAIFALSISRFVPGASKIILLFQRIIIAKDSLDLIYNTFVQLKPQKELTEKTVSRFSFQDMSMNNISFKYSSSANIILKNINLKIIKGDTIGIFGDSGSGKSTLLEIFLGLLKANEGDIKINNKDFYKANDLWKKNIGYISQNPYLFDDSILNNITFLEDKKKIDHKMIEKVIDMSQLRNFINNLPNGIETIVGDKGSRMSSGQKQRLAIARALYRDPQILVFDESTNALDSSTEIEILESIKNLNLRYGITILFVTHKLDLIRYFKHIYKVEEKSLIKYK
jgi:ABC-type bacteriocin/lantibiotic exporter with double-glycine peptidase domain